jgi:hypothetical protein
MNTKLSILFYIKRAKTTSQGKSPIYLRVTVDSKRTEFSIKRFVETHKWSSEQNKMKGNSEESRTLNTYLDILKSRIYEIQKDLIHSGKEVNGESIKIYCWELMKESECSFRYSRSITTEWKHCWGKNMQKER